MESFDELLKRALERKQPSAGFTDRVLAGTKKLATRNRRRWFRLPFWFAPALATLLVLAASLGYEHYRERQEGERASEQLVVALRLTGAKLHQVRSRVVEIGTSKEIDQ
jgi:type VI protein secretion system component VasF